MNLSPFQQDALTELLNIGVGRAAGVLNEMLDAHISLQIPRVQIIGSDDPMEVNDSMGGERISSVQMPFGAGFSGLAALAFPPNSASNLVAALTSERPGSAELDSLRVGALSEVGNIVINNVIGSIGNVLEREMQYGVPRYVEDSFDRLLSIDGKAGSGVMLLAQTRFSIEEHRIDGDILLFFELESFDQLLETIDTFVGSQGD